MDEEPENIMLILLRRIDAKLDRVIDDVREIKVRTTNLEENSAITNRRLDRIEADVERIKKRLDLVDA